MTKIALWGTGSYAERILASLPELENQIKFFVDNNPKRPNTFHGKPVIGPEQLAPHSFDALFISSVFHAEILAQALALGIPGHKILPAAALFFQRHRASLAPDVLERLSAVPWWYHRFEILPGVETPGVCRYKPELLDHQEVRDLTGLRALDIGAWDGPYTLEMTRRGAEVTAFDIQVPTHCGFDTMCKVNGLPTRHICANVYDLLPQQHGTFDLVTFFGVYYHLKNPLGALANINAVLKPGGIVLVEGAILEGAPSADAAWAGKEGFVAAMADVPMACYIKAKYEEEWSNWWVPNLTCLRDWVESSGFEILRSTTMEDSRRGVVVARKISEAPLEHPVLPAACSLPV